MTDDFGDTFWFYRHSDGYPLGTMPTLMDFLLRVDRRDIRNNGGQACGWLIIIGMEELAEIRKDLNSTWFDWKAGTYEPSVAAHADIDYLYHVDLDEMTITIMTPSEKVLLKIESSDEDWESKVRYSL